MSTGFENEKYRHEDKYHVSLSQSLTLTTLLNGIMKRDSHAEGGEYNVRSLYFDDVNNTRYYENENGVLPREKFRIRIYNHSADRITLELKRKENGMTQKIACPIDRTDVEKILSGKIPDTDSDSNPLMIKFVTEIKSRGLHPVIIVDYDRVPYVYPVGNVRVTIDKNISSSDNVRAFLDEAIPKRPVMHGREAILEVKWDNILPDFIKRTLNTGGLSNTGFSKYYYCRNYNLRGNRL